MHIFLSLSSNLIPPISILLSFPIQSTDKIFNFNSLSAQKPLVLPRVLDTSVTTYPNSHCAGVCLCTSAILRHQKVFISSVHCPCSLLCLEYLLPEDRMSSLSLPRAHFSFHLTLQHPFPAITKLTQLLIPTPLIVKLKMLFLVGGNLSYIFEVPFLHISCWIITLRGSNYLLRSQRCKAAAFHSMSYRRRKGGIGESQNGPA